MRGGWAAVPQPRASWDAVREGPNRAQLHENRMQFVPARSQVSATRRRRDSIATTDRRSTARQGMSPATRTARRAATAWSSLDGLGVHANRVAAGAVVGNRGLCRAGAHKGGPGRGASPSGGQSFLVSLAAAIGARSLLPTTCPLGLGNEEGKALSIEVSQFCELDDIHASFTRLRLRDERLRSAELGGNGRLGQARIFPRLPKSPKEGPVAGIVYCAHRLLPVAARRDISPTNRRPR